MKRRYFLAGLATTGSAVASGLLYKEWVVQKSIEHASLSNYNPGDNYDVCIIGTGPAGCTLANNLSNAGQNVLMLESGSTLDDLETLQSNPKLDKYTTSGGLEYYIHGTRFRALGGTSNIWSGRCPRLLPTDFSENPLAPNRKWPISYNDLQKFYSDAEKSLSVTGGKLSKYHAPRENDLPDSSRDISQLSSLLKPIGIEVDPPPLSSSRLLWLDRGPVRFYRDSIPSLSERGNVKIVTQATATSLHHDQSGGIVGVLAQSLDGTETVLKAKRFVIACGAIETIRLLQLSKSDLFPHGIGNHSGILGSYFMEHPWKAYTAEVPLDTEFEGRVLGRTYQFSNQLKSEGLGGALLGFYTKPPNKIKIALGIEMAPDFENKISLNSENNDAFGNPGANIDLNFAPLDNKLWQAGEDIIHSIFAKLNSGEIRKRDSIKWSHHHMGGTRMGKTEKDGVVDKNLKIFKTKNLYVASSSVFVTCGAANPTLTITALAHKLSEHLVNL